MPEGTNRVLDRRTLAHDNKNLLPWLRTGMSVLDVGCGSGAITYGIAEKVGTSGKVIGMDTSAELIQQAGEKYKATPNLSFVVADVHSWQTSMRFDLISSARTLQWLQKPQQAIDKMKSLLNDEGLISVLDYNHEKIEWSPAPPPSMARFYAAFLQWRKDAGMNNRIADSLEFSFLKAGLDVMQISDESELSRREDADFYQAAGIWKVVAETRGKQLVADGFISEEDRLTTIEEYDHWLTADAVSMKMYLRAITGQKKKVE